MVANRNSVFAEEVYGDSIEPSAVSLEEVRPAKPKPTRVYFYPLHNYANDRRYDPRSRDNDGASMLPYSDGYLERFEQTALPGWYYVELRAANQIIEGSVHEVKPGERLDSQKQLQVPMGTSQSVPSSSSRGIADAAQVVRETKNLISELVPPQQSSVGLAKDDVERMIEKALERIQPSRSDSNGVDFKEFYQLLRDERKEARDEVRAFLRTEPQVDPETQATIYFVKQTGALKEMLKATREVITTPDRIDEPTSWSDKILDFAREFVPYVGPRVAPKLADKLNALLDHVEPGSLLQVATRGNGTHLNGAKSREPQIPAPATGSDTRPEAIAGHYESSASDADAEKALPSMFPAELRHLFDQLVDALARDLSPELGASMLVQFLNDHPEHSELINGIMDDSPFNIVLALCQWPEYAYVAKLRHNATWISDLQEAFSELQDSQSEETNDGELGVANSSGDQVDDC